MTPSADPSPHMAFDPFNPSPHQRIGGQTIRFVRSDPLGMTLLRAAAAVAFLLALLAQA